MNEENSLPLPEPVARRVPPDWGWLLLVSAPFLFFFIGGLWNFAGVVTGAVAQVIEGPEKKVMFTGVSWLAVAWMCRPLRRGFFPPQLNGTALGAAVVGHFIFTPLGALVIWGFDHSVLMCMDRNYCGSSVVVLLLIEWQFLSSLWRAMKRSPSVPGKSSARPFLLAAGRRVLFMAGLAAFYPCGWLLTMASGRGGDPGFLFLFGLLFLWLGWVVPASRERAISRNARPWANDAFETRSAP